MLLLLQQNMLLERSQPNGSGSTNSGGTGAINLNLFYDIAEASRRKRKKRQEETQIVLLACYADGSISDDELNDLLWSDHWQ
jgi:hypothetical protein